MKEQDFRARLKHLYGDIPEETHLAFMQAVTGPKREKQTMSVPHLRFLPILLLLLAMLTGCTAAYASSPTGLFWYHHTIETYEWMEQTQPGLYNDIMNNLCFNPPQTVEDNEIANIFVTDISWIPNREAIYLYITASPKNADKVDLYPDGKLNVDGWEDDRTDNWLWTPKGFGPVMEQVRYPEKDIWFISTWDVLVNDTPVLQGYNPVYGPNETCGCWIELNLTEKRQSRSLKELLEQEQLTVTIGYSINHYDKETDEVSHTGERKKITVTIPSKSNRKF